MSRERSPRLPDPTSGFGALFYTVAGGLIVTALLFLLHHIHIVWA